MARQILVSSIVATAVAAALVLLLRDAPAAVVTPPAADKSSEAIGALREELKALRTEVAELRAARAVALPEEPAPAAAPNGDRPDAPAHSRTASPKRAAPQEDSYEAEVARAQRRFTMLGKRFQDQSRNAAWAEAREREIKALPTRHEYFKRTTFELVECRTTWCRVVATFPNDGEQGIFGETFHGFVPAFENASMFPHPGDNPFRTEVFLSTEGTLPR